VLTAVYNCKKEQTELPLYYWLIVTGNWVAWTQIVLNTTALLGFYDPQLQPITMNFCHIKQLTTWSIALENEFHPI